MAVFKHPTSTAQWADMLMPGLRGRQADAPASIIGTYLEADFVHDRLILGVQHVLFQGYELHDGLSRVGNKFDERVNQILQIKKKIPKQITVERRRMLWRGECARKAKAKKR